MTGASAGDVVAQTRSELADMRRRRAVAAADRPGGAAPARQPVRQRQRGLPRRTVLALPRIGHAGCFPAVALGSDRECKLVERDADSIMDGQVDGELVVAAAQVLHERVPGRDRA
jgi:hypothetical protein